MKTQMTIWVSKAEEACITELERYFVKEYDVNLSKQSHVISAMRESFETDTRISKETRKALTDERRSSK